MGVSLETLLSKLNYPGCRPSADFNGSVTVNSVKFLTRGNQYYEKDVLYVATCHELNSLPPIERSLNVICVGNRSLTVDAGPSSKLNLAYITGIAIFELFNKLNEILMADLKTHNAPSRLLNALVEGKGLQHIVDTGFELFGNPILVSDLSHKILAYTRTIDFGDPIWNELVKKGYRTYSLVITGNSRGLFDRIRRSEIPFVVSTEADQINKPYNRYPKLYTNITISNKTVGYITVVGVWKPFDINDIENASLFSRVVSQEMQKDKFFRNSRGMLFEYFISDLMDNRINDQRIMEERMKYLNLELKGNIYLMIIRSRMSISDNFIIGSMQRFDLESFGRPIIYNDDILLLVTRNSEITWLEDDLGRLGRIMTENDMVVGVSRCFRSLMNIREAYDQSLKALEIGLLIGDIKVFHNYEDYAIYHFITAHSKMKPEGLGTFCHPSLKLLEEHDQKYETDYIRSLCAFLENDKKLIETSNILHVHRNTLSSRMEKISEIMKLDLDDPDTTFHLLLSFKILKVEKAFRRQKPIESGDLHEESDNDA